MGKEYLISIGQRLRSIPVNQELRQYIILAFLPMLVIGGYYLWQNQGGFNQPAHVLSIEDKKPVKDEQKSPLEDTDKNTTEEIVTIKVDVSGAVVKPGLKEIPNGARVADALKLAGGLSTQADRQYIAQVLNLAQKLRDGDKIYLPSYYEVSQSLPAPVVVLDKAQDPLHVLSNAEPDEDQGSNNNDKVDKSSTPSNGLVNINTATQSELDSLPGIGPAYATKIIENRPYANKSEVCGKEVVNNSSTCEKIRDLIEV